MTRILFCLSVLGFLVASSSGMVVIAQATNTPTPTHIYATPTYNAATYTKTITPVSTGSVPGCPGVIGLPSEYNLNYLKNCSQCFPTEQSNRTSLPTYSIPWATKTLSGTPSTGTPTLTPTGGTPLPTATATWSSNHYYKAYEVNDLTYGSTTLVDGDIIANMSSYCAPGDTHSGVWFTAHKISGQDQVNIFLFLDNGAQDRNISITSTNPTTYGIWKVNDQGGVAADLPYIVENGYNFAFDADNWQNARYWVYNNRYMHVHHMEVICNGRNVRPTSTPTPTQTLCTNKHNPTVLGDVIGFISAANALGPQDNKYWFELIDGNIQGKAEFKVSMRDVSKISFKVPPGEIYANGPFWGSFTARVIGCNNELITQYDQLTTHITNWGGWDFTGQNKCVDKIVIDYNPREVGMSFAAAVSHIEITGCPIPGSNVCLSPSLYYQQPVEAGFGFSGFQMTVGSCATIVPAFSKPFEKLAEWIPDDWTGFWDTMETLATTFSIDGFQVCPTYVSMPNIRIFNFDLPLATLITFGLVIYILKTVLLLFS